MASRSLKRLGKGPKEQIDADLKDAVAIASAAAPYRYPRLKAVTLAGDQNNPLQLSADASREDIRAEIMKHLTILAPVLDLQALVAPAEGIADRDVPRRGSRQ
jgi:hypothetical protein